MDTFWGTVRFRTACAQARKRARARVYRSSPDTLCGRAQTFDEYPEVLSTVYGTVKEMTAEMLCADYEADEDVAMKKAANQIMSNKQVLDRDQ